jgi:ArsR family transcriptional regulator, arsenate/arsenite/antimonite-responsive transcriptional repressor
MSMDRSSERLVRVAKALGDPTRLELLRRIGTAGETCCKDLVALFPVSQATVSHHLKILVDAGLLAVRRDGQFGWYSLRPAAVESHAALLGRTLRTRRGARRAAGDAPRRKGGAR